ncbi:MAG: carbamate kinase [Acidimicrobiales bacterium]
MRVVVALGGNALIRRGEPLDAAVQRANLKTAAAAIAELAEDHQVIVTHGNGPQVGLLALQNEAYTPTMPYPLDILDAETEGMVGYLLEQELGRHLDRDRLACLLTQVVVDPLDPAFLTPTKPIGPVYGRDEADLLRTSRDWTLHPDGDGWRRVVPSPKPCQIVELNTIRLLVDHGIVVICAGGGGIPVVPDGDDGLRGVEAVIDKDHSASLLATRLQADALLLLTDVDAVYADWATPSARPIHETTADDLRGIDAAVGSMGPKIEAVCSFVDSGGSLGAIGALGNAAAILRGDSGTVVRAAHTLHQHRRQRSRVRSKPRGQFDASC